MQYLQKLDLFRVVQDRDAHLTPASRSGGTLSTVCLIVTAILVSNELWMAMRSDLRSSLRIADNYMDSELVKFNVSFPHTHCSWIQFLAFDQQSGSEVPDVQRTLKMTRTRLLKGTTVAMSEYVDEHATPHRDDEGCQASGHFHINRVPGNFYLAAKGAGHGQARGDHIIHQFSVGDNYGLAKTLIHHEHFSVSLFNTLEDTTRHNDDADMVYQYYLQIIPVYLKDEKSDRVTDVGYQYTVQESAVSAPGVPQGLYFRHQHSSVAVECYFHKTSISHFLVHLCAIIGGVYTVASFFVPACEFLKKKFPHLSGAMSSPLEK